MPPAAVSGPLGKHLSCQAFTSDKGGIHSFALRGLQEETSAGNRKASPSNQCGTDGHTQKYPTKGTLSAGAVGRPVDSDRPKQATSTPFI